MHDASKQGANVTHLLSAPSQFQSGAVCRRGIVGVLGIECGM